MHELSIDPKICFLHKFRTNIFVAIFQLNVQG